MFREFFRRLFHRQVDYDNPYAVAIAEVVWRTGKPVIGNVDEDGNLHIEIIGDEPTGEKES